MTTEVPDILSSLIDREPVDPDTVARLLEEPEARAMLVDFVRLREIVASDDEHRGGVTGRPPKPRAGAGMWMRSAAALVLLGTGLGTGVWIGEQTAAERPPAPARVVALEPGVEPLEAGSVGD